MRIEIFGHLLIFYWQTKLVFIIIHFWDSRQKLSTCVLLKSSYYSPCMLLKSQMLPGIIVPNVRQIFPQDKDFLDVPGLPFQLVNQGYVLNAQY